jgi:uncharacterized protein (TIRG00374 family)
VLGAAIVVLAAHLARAERWRFFIADGRKIGLRNAFAATVIGYFMNNLIPRSGEIVRPFTLARKEGHSTSALLATVVVERVLDGLTLLAILGGIILLTGDRLVELIHGIDRFADYTTSDLILQLAVPVLVLVTLLLVMLATPLGTAIVEWIGARLPKKIGGRVVGLFHEFRQGARFTGGYRGAIGVFIWTIVIWAGYIGSLHCGVLAFDLTGQYGLTLADSTLLLGVTAVGMAIAPTPGGFGVFHTFARVALVSLYGVPVDVAVAFAFVTHFAQYAVSMIVGAWFVIREGVSLSRAVDIGTAQTPPETSTSKE